MNKQSVLDKVLKSIIVASLCFLYWSSDLLERDIKSLDKKIQSIQTDVKELLRLVKQGQVHGDVSPVLVVNEPVSSQENLLVPDPYMRQVLPNLLGEGFTPKGVLRTASVGKPDNLNPFNGFDSIVRMYDLCVASLAQPHMGKYGQFAPGLAQRIEIHETLDGSSDKEFHVYLRHDVFWEPIQQDLFPKHLEIDSWFLQAHPVTAHDFKFYYDAVMNPHLAEMRAVALRSCFEDVVSFIVENDFKFIVRWKAHPVMNELGEEEMRVLYSAFFNTLELRPLPCFVYQYFPNGQKIVEDSDPSTYRHNSLWAQNFNSHWAYNYIVSCGPYRFAGMDEEKLMFVRNPDYYDPLAALIEKRWIYIKESSDAMFQDFKAGKIDISYLPPNQLDNLSSFMKSSLYKRLEKNGERILEISSPDRSYTYIGWNCQNILFENRRVRRALNMAIDCDRIISQCLDGKGVGISGPFALFSPSNDPSVEGWHFSQEEAAHLLEEEGWVDADGDGIREKIIDGVVIPFRFHLTYFVKSQTARLIAEQVATGLKEIGIDCRLLGLDMADYSQAFEEKHFDALLAGWVLGLPPEDPRALWHSEEAREKGSANAIGFSHPEADRIIDQLSYEYDPQKRQELYHRFHALIHEEAPYAFLFSRSFSLVHKEYVKNIFIPTDHLDLIPGAEDKTINQTAIWLEHKEGGC